MENEAVQRVLDRLEGVTSSGGGWSARCPAHDDAHASLSVNEGEAGVLVYCHAGCATEDVVRAVGMTMSDLAGEPRIVASYPYTDDDGNVLYTMHRWSPKRFTVEPTGLRIGDRTLYARQWINYARQTGSTLYIVEGEKDADTLLNQGIPATCNPHGAGAWHPHYTQLLSGINVVIVADNDQAGIDHARSVFRQVEPIAKSCKVARPMYGKDVSDLFGAGFGIDRLEPVPERAGLQTFRADQVMSKPVTWAWKRYVPFHAMTLIDGDPASGKSTFTIDLAARWSTGMEMPDGSEHDGPYDVVMISAEDDPEYTLAPRLQGAGARLDRIHLVTGGMREDSAFNLGVDLPALEQMIVDTGARILTLDPLAAFLPSGMDSRMDTEVRNALQPVIHLTKRLGTALVVVRHLTKSQTKAMYAGGGSVGFIAAARAAFLIHGDPSSGDQHKVMAPIKTNLTRQPPALSYSIESMETNEEIPHIVWHGPAEWDAQQLLDGKAGRDERTARLDSQEYLTALLEGSTFPGMTWQQIAARARQDGYSEHTLRRARGDLGEVGTIRKVVNPVGDNGITHLGTWWQLAEQDQPATTQGDGDAHLPTHSVLENVGKRASPSPSVQPDEDEDRHEALDALPLVCDVCGEAEEGHVLRFGKPFYVVRCQAHNPFLWRP